MKAETVSRDCGLSVDDAQKAIDNNQVDYDLKTCRYYLRPIKDQFNPEVFDRLLDDLQEGFKDFKGTKRYSNGQIYSVDCSLEDLKGLTERLYSYIKKY